MLCTAFFCLLQYRYDNKYAGNGNYGSHGVLDLRTSGKSAISILTGGWEYYPQELISPGGFDGRQPEFIYLGQRSGFETGAPGSAPHGCATYRLRILLPEEPQEYALELPEIYTSSAVWVDGRPVSRLGDMTSDASSPPLIRTGMVTFQAAREAEIVVWAADSRHYYSGMVYPPAFGGVPAVSGLLSFRFLRTCVMVIASLTIGILYLLIGIRIKGKRMRMILFSLVSLSFALHTSYPLFHQFGAGYWTYRLEDGSFYLFLALLAALHCDLCRIKGRPHLMVLTVAGTMAAVSMTVPALLSGKGLKSLLIYSALIDGYRLALFGWMIATAFLNRESRVMRSCLLLSGLCMIASALSAQCAMPSFEPVRFGWPVENAGFVFVLLLAGGLWYDTVNAYGETAALAENMRLMKKQFALQEENYRLISANFEEMRRIRHDMRHHFNTLWELSRQKQYQALEAYLKGCRNSSEPEPWPVLCENSAANAVLTYYQKLALEKGIPFSVRVSLPEHLKLEGWDLGILLGNLLENAFEASEKLPLDKRDVQVLSRISKGSLLLTVKNRWNGEFTSQAGQVRSTKHTGNGIGLASVQSLVEKNGGQFYLVPGGSEFEISIVLWNQV